MVLVETELEAGTGDENTTASLSVSAADPQQQQQQQQTEAKSSPLPKLSTCSIQFRGSSFAPSMNRTSGSSIVSSVMEKALASSSGKEPEATYNLTGE